MRDAKTLYKEGVQALKSGDKDHARHLLQESLQLDKDNVEVWLWFARTQSTPEKALRCVDRALKLDPDNTAARKMQAKYQSYIRKSVQQDAHLFEQKRLPSTPGKPMLSVGTRPWHHFLHVVYIVVNILMVAFILTGFVHDIIPNFSLDEVRSGNIRHLLEPLILLLVGGMFIKSVFDLLYELGTTIGRKIYLYENGFSTSNAKDAPVYLWQDIDTVRFKDQMTDYRWIGIHVFKHVDYKLIFKKDNKRVLKLSRSYQKYRDVGAAILRRSLPVIAKAYARKLKQGDVLNMEGFDLDGHGISEKDHSRIKWRDIASINVVDDEKDMSTCLVRVRLKDQTDVSYDSKIFAPNLEILPYLLAEMRS